MQSVLLVLALLPTVAFEDRPLLEKHFLAHCDVLLIGGFNKLSVTHLTFKEVGLVIRSASRQNPLVAGWLLVDVLLIFLLVYLNRRFRLGNGQCLNR